MLSAAAPFFFTPAKVPFGIDHDFIMLVFLAEIRGLSIAPKPFELSLSFGAISELTAESRAS